MHTYPKMIVSFHLKIILLFVSTLIIFASCDSPFGDDSDSDNGSPAASVPEITNAYLIEADDSSGQERTEIEIGQSYRLLLTIRDADLDASRVAGTETGPDGQPSTIDLTLESQDSAEQTYATIEVEAAGPAGNYTMKLTATDSAGNQSPEYSFSYSVQGSAINVRYSASSSSNDGSFVMDYYIQNIGSTSLTMTNASFTIYGTGGIALTDITKTTDTLVYDTVSASSDSETYRLAGYSDQYVPAGFGLSFTFSTSDGTVHEWSGSGDFNIGSSSISGAQSELSATGTTAFTIISEDEAGLIGSGSLSRYE